MRVRPFGCLRVRDWFSSIQFMRAGFVLLLSLVAAPVAAQNLLVNPDLTSNLTGWDPGANTTFDGALGSPGPGSALWQTTLVGGDAASEYVIVSQCVDGIIPGTTYDFGGQFLITTGSGTANIVIGWQTNPGCSGLTTIEAASPVSTTGSWVGTTGSGTAPAGTSSVQLIALAGVSPFGPGPVTPTGTTVPGAHVVNADSLFFMVAATPVPIMDLPWLLLLAIGLGLMVVLRLTRRQMHGLTEAS